MPHLLSLALKMSGLWLAGDSFPDQIHKIVPAVSIHALEIYPGLLSTGYVPLATRRCRDCRTVVDTLASYWLSTCRSSREVCTRQHTAINHALRVALHGSGYTTTLELLLMDLISHHGDSEIRADLQGKWGRRSAIHLCGCGNYLPLGVYLLGWHTVLGR